MKEDKKRTLVDALNALLKKRAPQNSSYYSSILHPQQAICWGFFPPLLVHSLMLILKKNP